MSMLITQELHCDENVAIIPDNFGLENRNELFLQMQVITRVQSYY